MFTSPTSSFKTGKKSLQTAETSKKYLCFFTDIKNGGCIHRLSTEHLMYKTKRAAKQKLKQKMNSSLSQNLFRNLFAENFTPTERKDFKK